MRCTICARTCGRFIGAMRADDWQGVDMLEHSDLVLRIPRKRLTISGGKVSHSMQGIARMQMLEQSASPRVFIPTFHNRIAFQ